MLNDGFEVPSLPNHPNLRYFILDLANSAFKV